MHQDRHSNSWLRPAGVAFCYYGTISSATTLHGESCFCLLCFQDQGIKRHFNFCNASIDEGILQRNTFIEMLSITVLLLLCVAYCSLNARTSRCFCSSFVSSFRFNSCPHNAYLAGIGGRTLLAMNDSTSISSHHGKGDDANDNDDKYLTTKTSQEVICHPVLRQVYPDLMVHKIKFGHPNIPLGSSAGRCDKCSGVHLL